MKLRILIATFLAFVSMSITAFAVDTMNVDLVDISTKRININGTLLANEDVMLIVTPPDTDLSKVTEAQDKIKSQWETTTDSNGLYAFDFTLFTTDTDASGYYGIYVKSKSLSTPAYDKLYVATNSDLEQCIADINSSDVSKLTNAVDDYIKIFGLEGFSPVGGASSTELAAFIKSKAPFGGAAYGDVQDAIKEGAIVSCLNNGKIEYLVDDSYNIKYDDFIGLTALKSEYSSNLYDIYNNVLTVAGKKQVMTSLTHSKPSSLSEVVSSFAKSVMVNAISNSKTMGSEHISSLLTTQNANVVGISLTEYFNNQANKNRINNELLKIGTFQSPSDITSAISKIVKSIKASSSTSGGGGGGGGGGSANGGVVAISSETSKQDEYISWLLTPFTIKDATAIKALLTGLIK